MPVINIPPSSTTPEQRFATLQRNWIEFERQEILAEQVALAALAEYFKAQRSQIKSQKNGICGRIQRLEAQARTRGLTAASARECANLRAQVIRLDEDTTRHIEQFDAQYTARRIQYEARVERFNVLFGY